MEFPRFVFTAPGPLPCNGGTYGEKIVKDQDEFDAAIDAGFFGTIPAALGLESEVKAEEEVVVVESKFKK